MSARDTFEWLVSTNAVRDPDVVKFLNEQREYLLALRSEDERQRFVDGMMEELRSMILVKKGL